MAVSQVKDYGIDYVVNLINYNDSQTVNITKLIAELNIYQCVFSNTIKIDILISDAVGLAERFPIVGDEKIVVRIKTIKEKKARKYVFDMYKLDKRQLIEERQHSYVLHGVSRQGLADTVNNVYKPYIDTPISDIVSSVYSEFLQPAGDKSLNVESTDGKYSIIGSGQTPIQFINRLAREAQTSKNQDTSTYLFYEDDDQFNFVTLGSLFEKTSVEDFYLGDPSDSKLKDSKNNIKPYQTILGLTFETGFDTVDGMLNGVYKNRVDSIDPILRKFETKTFDYMKDYDKLNHISGKKYISDSGTIAKGEGNSHRRMMVTQLSDNDYTQETYISGKTSGDVLLNAPRVRQKYINQSISELGNMGQYTLSITVPGNTNLTVGELVNVHVPQPSDVKDDGRKYLKLFGRDATFLITDLKHTYKAPDDMFVTVLTCVKESFGADIKSEYKSRDQGA